MHFFPQNFVDTAAPFGFEGGVGKSGVDRISSFVSD